MRGAAGSFGPSDTSERLVTFSLRTRTSSVWADIRICPPEWPCDLLLCIYTALRQEPDQQCFSDSRYRNDAK